MKPVESTLASIEAVMKEFPPAWEDLCQNAVSLMYAHKSPASASHHHVYPCGLLYHTEEVLLEARRRAFAANLSPEEIENLSIAAIIHDVMKVRECKSRRRGESFVYENTPYRKLIRHVAGSYAWFESQCDSFWISDQEKRMQIGHLILSHHGKYEWGSPVEPQTPAARILHEADMWSASQGPSAYNLNGET